METINAKIANLADRYAIDILGIPSLLLMRRASEAVCDHIPENLCVAVLAGVGNNGGDGATIASILHSRGQRVVLYICGNLSKGSWEFLHQLSEAKRLGVDIVFCDEETDIISGDDIVLVDALFGTGLKREVGGFYRKILELAANKKFSLIVAVDMPSGINTDNGQVMGIALPADVTVTFGRNKTGLTIGEGPNYSGEIIVSDIGIPDISYEKANYTEN